jgi:hypothetical protein
MALPKIGAAPAVTAAAPALGVVALCNAEVDSERFGVRRPGVDDDDDTGIATADMIG